MTATDYSAQLAPEGTSYVWSDGHSPVILGAGQDVFGAEYSREGRDLVLRGEDGPPVRVVDYFAGGEPVPLRGADGGELSGVLVSRLAGPLAAGEYAQSGGVVAGVPIGQVERLVGASSVQRADGSVETLQAGMKVFENDVVATEVGANLSLTFADGTVFTLSGASRMVLTEMLYDPGSSSTNSAIFNLVQGSFVFIAGQVAKTGGIEITTPAATMGVRGTTVRVDVDVVGGETVVTCTLNPDPDGSLGQIEIRDLDGNLLTNVTGIDSKWVISTADGELQQLPRLPGELAEDSVLLLEATESLSLALQRVSSGETFVDLPAPTVPVETDEGAPADEFNTGVDEDLEGAPVEEGGVQEPEGEDVPPEPVEDEPVPLEDVEPVPLDTAPEVDDSLLEIEEDTEFAGRLGGIDPDGDTLNYRLVEGPVNGQLSLDADGRFTYLPDENFNGTDGFVYEVSDASGNSVVATTSILVLGRNDAPELMIEAQAVSEHAPALILDLADYADDPDPGEDGTTLVYEISGVTLTEGRPGGDDDTLSPDFAEDDAFLRIEGTLLIFDPSLGLQDIPAGEQIVVTVEVTATDAAGAQATQSFDIAVSGENLAPVLLSQQVAAVEDGPAVTLDLAALASDAEGGALTFALTGAPAEGVATIEGAVLTFDPGEGFQDLAEGETRIVTLEVTATDPEGAVAVQIFDVAVTGTGDAPTLSVVPISATEDGGAVTLDLALLTSDPDDSALTFSLAGGVAEGQAAIEDTLLIFDPVGAFQDLAEGEVRSVTLDVTATDGSGAAVTETLTVDVTGVNDAPEALDTSVSVSEGGGAEGQIAATDVDGDALDFSLLEGPTGGSLTLDAGTGAYSYSAQEDFGGIDRFSVAIEDPSGATVTSEVVVAVGQDSLDTGNGQVLSMALDAGGMLRIGTGSTAAAVSGADADAAINIVFAIDVSQSIGAEAFAAATQTLADAAAVLAADYAGTGVSVEVHVVTYSAVVNDSGPYDLSTDLEALTADLLALELVGPGTRWDEALEVTEAILDGQPAGESNTVIFVSDGAPTRDFSDELASLTDAETNGYDVDIAAFGVDEGSDLDALAVVDSGGAATVLTGADDIVSVVPQAPTPEAVLVDFSLELIADGVSQGVIAGIEDLTQTETGFALDLAALEGIDAVLGEANAFVGSASFDLDGDTATTGDVETLVLQEILSGEALMPPADAAFLPLPEAPVATVPDQEVGQGDIADLTLDDVLDVAGEESTLIVSADTFAPVGSSDGEAPLVVPAETAAAGDGSALVAYDFVGGAGDVLASLGIDIDATVDLVPSA